MNKWQIICPLLLLFAVALWGGHRHLQNQEMELNAAVEHQLSSTLAELEKHQDRGRFPTVEAAREILGGQGVEKRVHTTSLFGDQDLLYNRAQPAVGSDAVVLCAQVGKRLFRIRANRELGEISIGDLRPAGFLRLVKTEELIESEAAGVSNR